MTIRAIPTSTPPADPRHLPEVSVIPAPSATARVLACISGKESLPVTALAAALTRQKKKVCLLEARKRRDATAADPCFLLTGQSLDGFLKRDTAGIWRAPPVRDIGAFKQLTPRQKQRLLSAFRYLERRFDYLLIDTGDDISDWLTELRLAAPRTLLTITPESGSMEWAIRLLEEIRPLGFTHTVYLIIDQVSSLLAGHDSYILFQQRLTALDIDLRCSGFLLKPGNQTTAAPPGSVTESYLDIAAARLGDLIDQEEGGNAGIGRFFEQQLPDQRRPEKPKQARDLETAGLLAASYHAALSGTRL